MAAPTMLTSPSLPTANPPFSPKTGTPLSLRDISPIRGITFQERLADESLKFRQ